MQNEEFLEDKKTQYKRDRFLAYQMLNQFELMFNDLVNGTSTWKDAIEDIKEKFPKPLEE